MDLRALVVHADARTRLRLHRILSGGGLVLAHDEAEALELLKARSFDLVVADHAGVQLAEHARAEGIETPFVLVAEGGGLDELRGDVARIPAVVALPDVQHPAFATAVNQFLEAATPWQPRSGL